MHYRCSEVAQIFTHVQLIVEIFCVHSNDDPVKNLIHRRKVYRIELLTRLEDCVHLA